MTNLNKFSSYNLLVLCFCLLLSLSFKVNATERIDINHVFLMQFESDSIKLTNRMDTLSQQLNYLKSKKNRRLFGNLSKSLDINENDTIYIVSKTTEMINGCYWEAFWNSKSNASIEIQSKYDNCQNKNIFQLVTGFATDVLDDNMISIITNWDYFRYLVNNHLETNGKGFDCELNYVDPGYLYINRIILIDGHISKDENIFVCDCIFLEWEKEKIENNKKP